MSLNLIGHGHIDPVWLWNWQEGMHEVHATFRSALDRMNEDPDFCYTASSACFYEWIEELDPEMFAEIQRRVSEGRWEIAGGMYVEPDCNIPAGESFARHFLISQRYFREKFGTAAEVGFNPDSFGHQGQYPQLLNQAGIGKYVFMRPGPHEKELPGEVFKWQGIDGTQVQTMRIVGSYNGEAGEGFDEELERIKQVAAAQTEEGFAFYGVGNHGGGPTRRTLRHLRELMAQGKDYRFGTMGGSFSDIKPEELPVVCGDLQFHAKGCYSVCDSVKRNNAKAEQRLLAAERLLAAYGQVLGAERKRDYCAKLLRCWKTVLFNQFHDIMAGSSMREAYDDNNNQLGGVLATADSIINHIIQAVSWEIDIPYDEDRAKGEKHFVVWNPHCYAGTFPIEIENMFGSSGFIGVEEASDSGLTAYEYGDTVGHRLQSIQSSVTCHGRVRLVFNAELPALGYKVFRITHTPKASAEYELFASKSLKAVVSEETGLLVSLKKDGKELLSAPACACVVYNDFSDTWSHGIAEFRDEAGRFAFKSYKVIENGPVRSTVRVEAAYGASTMRMFYTLYRDTDRFDIRCELDWHEEHAMLKLEVPTAIKGAFTTACPYGFIEKPADGAEQPCHRWIAVSNDSRSLYVINDGKYSCCAVAAQEGVVLYTTLLRSPVFAHHDPKQLDPDTTYHYMDQGIHEFALSLLPGGDAVSAAKLGESLVYGVVPMEETYHSGKLPQTLSKLTVTENVHITCLKPAEDGNGIIMRGYEPAGVAASAAFDTEGTKSERTLHPFEVFSVRIAEGKAVPVNILEDEL